MNWWEMFTLVLFLVFIYGFTWFMDRWLWTDRLNPGWLEKNRIDTLLRCMLGWHIGDLIRLRRGWFQE